MTFPNFIKQIFVALYVFCLSATIAVYAQAQTETGDIQTNITDDFSGVKLGMNFSQAVAVLRQNGYHRGDPENSELMLYSYDGTEYYYTHGWYKKTDANGIEYDVSISGSGLSRRQKDSWSSSSRIFSIEGNYTTPNTSFEEAKGHIMSRYPHGKIIDDKMSAGSGVSIIFNDSFNLLRSVTIVIQDERFQSALKDRLYERHPEVKLLSPKPNF